MKKLILPICIGLALAGCKKESQNPEAPEPDVPPIPAPTDKAPVASNLTLLGDPMLGNTLTVDYDFHDDDGDLEHGTVITWYIQSGGGTLQVQAGSSKSLELSGLAGVVGTVYADVHPQSDSGENKAKGSVVTSPSLKTYLAGDKPNIQNVELLAPKALADGVQVSAFYDYFDADGDAEDPNGAEFLWVNRNDGQTLSTASSLILPSNFAAMDIELEITPRSISNDDGAHGKPQGDTMVYSLVNDVEVNEPVIYKLRTATAGWGDNVYLIKNIRNQLLLARAEYSLNAHGQTKLAKVDVYKVSDRADVYTFEGGFLRSSDAAFDHLTLTVGVNGAGADAADAPTVSVTADEYFGVKIGRVPHTGAAGGSVSEFIKPTDVKDWSLGATLYTDGSVLLDQDVFFNGVSSASNWGGASVDTVDIVNEPHLNLIDAGAPAASWFDSPIGVTVGSNDPVLGTGAMESGDHSDTTAMQLSTLISNGVNTDAVPMGSGVDDIFSGGLSISGNSTLQSNVRPNKLYWLMDRTAWSADEKLKDYYNSHLVSNFPTVIDDSDLIASIGLGGENKFPMLFSRKDGDSFIYSHDFFDGSPSAMTRYILPFDVGITELISVCTNTNSMRPPLLQGAGDTDPDVDLQRPDGAAAPIAVDLSKGGNGALIGFDRASKSMWYVDTDYASGGVTLSHDETGVVDIRTATSFAGCNPTNNQQPAVFIKNETTEDVSVLSTAAFSRSFTTPPRDGSGVMFSLTMKSGSEGLSGDWATPSYEQALTDAGIFSATFEDVDAWVRTDDTDLFMRVIDYSSGTMVFQDFSGSLFGTSYVLTGIDKVMYDAETKRVASDQEGFAVDRSGMVLSTFADTLRIGGVNNIAEFAASIPEFYDAVNDHSGSVGDVVTVSFDYVTSNYPYREQDGAMSLSTIADDFRSKAAGLVLK